MPERENGDKPKSTWNEGKFNPSPESLEDTLVADLKMARDSHGWTGDLDMMRKFSEAYLSRIPNDDELEKIVSGLDDPTGNGLEVFAELEEQGYDVSRLEVVFNEAVINQVIQHATSERVSAHEEKSVVVSGSNLTPEEEIELSAYRIRANSENQLPDDEAVARKRAEIVARRGASDNHEFVFVEGEELKVDEEGEKTERSREDILKDLHRVGERLSPEERNSLIERLRADGIILSDDINEDTPNGEWERMRLREALEVVGGERTAGSRAGWESEQAAVDYLNSIGLPVQEVSDETGDTARNTQNSDRTENPDLEIPRTFEQELEEIETLTDPRDRLDAYTSMSRDLKKKRPDGWVDQVRVLREKIDGIEAGRSTINVEEAQRQFENVLNINSIDTRTRRQAAQRWIDRFGGRPETADLEEQLRNEVVDFKLELKSDQQNQIRQFCLDEVFDRNARSEQGVIRNLFGDTGFLYTKLGIPLEQTNLVREEVNKIAEELGLENWMAVRDTVSEWDRLKKPGLELTAGELNASLFLPEYAERFFAGVVDPDNPRFITEDRVITLPDGSEHDMEVEISAAMKKLREVFESTDYFVYAGLSLSKKSQLYESIGINKYVGEVAFALLQSHLMLTDAKKTATDPFMTMVCGARKRVANYDVEEDRDPIVSARVQYLLATGYDRSRLFNSNHKLTDEAKEDIERWLTSVFPGKLIPTGHSGAGADALEQGRWLRWRVQNTYTSSERIGNKAYIANDTDTRLAEMRSALEVLNAMKEVAKPESAVTTLGALKGKLMIHIKATLPTAGWGVPATISPEFDYFSDGGRSVSSDEWATVAMLTACETFMFTHSISNHLNKKPADPGILSEAAKYILSKKTQSEQDALLGFDPALREQYRQDFVDYVDFLWKQSFDVIRIVGNDLDPKYYPNWWSSGVRADKALVESAREWMKMDKKYKLPQNYWASAKKEMGYK